ncbi:MAG: SurA N-terminal domain-containing protein [Deltaproteobacteria bacterium]|nr:SurA N-terminal domain-containing protein [Deltaproteobacteria bacterium]
MDRIHSTAGVLRIGRWFAGCLLLVGLWTAGLALAEEIVDRIVAVVNDDIITYLELQKELKPYEERIKSMGYSEEKERRMLYKVRDELIYRLIDEKLADQEIKKNKITVDDAEIDASIERLKASKMWTDEDLRNALEAEGMTLQEYRRSLKNQILRSRLVGREVSSKIVITTEDVRAYYDSHADEYMGDLSYHLRNIIAAVDANAGGVARAKARAKIDAVMEKLNAGESFEALARQYSESPLAKDGGDLGTIPYADFSPQIQGAIEGLKAGDHTAVMDTERGYQIFYVEDVVMKGGKSFEQASPEIEEKLYNAAVDEKYGEWLEALKKKSHIKIIR